VGPGFPLLHGVRAAAARSGDPLHKRSADSPIQVYISLGQAF
jgi:hypothetical protein